MVTDLLFHLYAPLRALRRAVIPLGLLLIFGYLVLNATYSERGYFNMQKRQAELQKAEAELAMLHDERAALEHRVNLLKGEAVGRDLLEEEARRVLNVAHQDEIIVRMPPTADRLYGAEKLTPGAGGTENRH
jgi:cell division protein FtsB